MFHQRGRIEILIVILFVLFQSSAITIDEGLMLAHEIEAVA